jgi:DNA-binding NarL/FixJ family response regulator
MLMLRIAFIGKANQTNTIIFETLKSNFEAEIDFVAPKKIFSDQPTYKLRKEDIIIIDLNTSYGFGNRPENVRSLSNTTQNIPILILDHHEDKSFIKYLIQAGAAGIISHTPAEEELIHAVNELISGNTLFNFPK